MCGIYGSLDLAGRKAPLCAEQLARMGDITRHRGPDDAGCYIDGPLAFGMRRLSIIDVSGGHQPISNEDGSVTIVCNGEIYNFRALREQLISRGHRFTTSSDSEVLLHLYEEVGVAAVEQIEGMFGFAIWDRHQQRLVVGRDRLGIKPMYIMSGGGRVSFSSELKALLTLPGYHPELDPVALREYLALGYVPAPLTMLAGIQKLEPGHVLICERGAVRKQRYWRPSPGTSDPSLSERDWIERLREAIEASVVSQMVSDVPLGAFLSGGVDSSTVVGMMAKHSNAPVRTYAIGFDSGPEDQLYNELPFAQAAADHFDTQHRDILVRPDVATLMPRLLWHMDEPIADSAFITTYLVSEFAVQDVKVILSGVGGDELFGGYRRYLGDHYGRIYRKIPAPLRRGLMVPIARRLPSDRHTRLNNLLRYAKAFILSEELTPQERYREYVGVFANDDIEALMAGRATGAAPRFDAFAAAFDALEATDPVNGLMELDLLTQMPDDLLMLTDKMTMAASIECRVPLLDERLVALALEMPSDVKIKSGRLKHVLKEAATGLLPDRLINRSKRGFGAPMGAWLKSQLSGFAGRLLAPEVIERRGWLDPERIQQVQAQHHRNEADHTDHIQALVNLEIWARMYLDGRSYDDVATELREYV